MSLTDALLTLDRRLATGDIHLFLVGDVRTNLGSGESVAVEFVGERGQKSIKGVHGPS